MGENLRNLLLAVGTALSFSIDATAAMRCMDHYSHLADVATASKSSIKAPRLSEVKAGRILRDASGKFVVPRLKARAAPVRPDVDAYERGDADYQAIVIKFNDDSLVKASAGRLALPDEGRSAELSAILNRYAGLDFEPTIKAGEDWLTAFRFCAADSTGLDAADLTAYFTAKLPSGMKKAAPGLVRALLQFPEVETAYLTGPVGSIGVDIGSQTPQFEAAQRHWGTNGINIRGYWPTLGVKGEGLRYVDVEADLPVNHEDFPAVSGGFGADGHSTAVIGILSAEHNTFGHHGGVPAASARVATNVVTPYTSDLVSLFQAGQLAAGDSMLIEVALLDDPKGCPRFSSQFGVPLERRDDAFDQIQQLSANGVIVYEGSGNDAQNLDGCLGTDLARNSARGDSGAIMVAASHVNTDVTGCANPAQTTTWASFSSYGTRIDAYSWGSCVHTTGVYNDLWFDPDPSRQNDRNQWYTRIFNGTSAATPIVMSAGMAIQGWQKQRTGRAYNPMIIRSLLRQYGTAGTSPQPIGSEPNVGAMLTWLQADADGDGVSNGDELSMGQDLVDHYYDKILHRAPEPGGKLFWHGQVQHLRTFDVDPREGYRALARVYFFSPEYLGYNYSNNQFVEDLYQTFYQRAADSGGMSYWVGQLNSGLPREAAVGAFMFSQEFTNYMDARLTATPQRVELGLIVGGYRGARSVLPDDGGIGGWRASLRSAICQGWSATHSEASNLMTALFFHPGYDHAGRTDMQYVADLYDAVLGRAGDLGGVQYWASQVNGNRQAILNIFLNSGEFYQRITNAVSQNPQCVQ